MDLSTLLSTVLSNDSLSGLGQAAGVSADQVQGVLGAALPSLLNGALAQSEGEDTAESFAGALEQHAADDTNDLAAFLGKIDMADGAKIVAHLLGNQQTAVADEAAQKAGVISASSANVLAAAAPLLMSLLGKETGNQQQQNSSLGIAGILGALLKNADIGSILSGLLGGGSAAAQPEPEPEPEPAVQPVQEDKKPGGILGAILSLFK